VGSVVRGTILLYKLVISVVAYDDKADGNGDHGTEISEKVQPSWSDLDVVVRSFFKMLHLIDEFWSLCNQIDDLVLIAFSVDFSCKLCLCRLRQKSRHRLGREVDRHDVVVFLYFYVSGILFEELIDICTREGFDFLSNIGKGYCQLVYQAVDVEAFNDLFLE